MGDITLDHVPQDLYDRTAERARLNGRTVDEEARAILIAALSREPDQPDEDSPASPG